MRVAVAEPGHDPAEPPDPARRGKRHRHRIGPILQDVTGSAIHAAIFGHPAVEEADSSRPDVPATGTTDQTSDRSSHRHQPSVPVTPPLARARCVTRTRPAGGRRQAITATNTGGRRQAITATGTGIPGRWTTRTGVCGRAARRLEPDHPALSPTASRSGCRPRSPPSGDDRRLFGQHRRRLQPSWPDAANGTVDACATDSRLLR